MAPTPWNKWLKAAAQMGIAPLQFWRLSLVEWRALIASQSTPTRMTRADLDALMQHLKSEE